MTVWWYESETCPSYLCRNCRTEKYGTGSAPTFGMTQADVDLRRERGSDCACRKCGAQPHSPVQPWALGQKDTTLVAVQ